MSKQKHERRTLRTVELRVSRSEDGKRTLTGLIPYNVQSVDMYGFTEMIAPGAFASALEADADVLALRDHDPRLLLGRTKSKTLTLTDSTEGLRYSIDLPNTPTADELVELVSREDIDGTSFGFICIEDKWAATDDTVLRTIMQAELDHVSPCSYAAYPDAKVDLRSLPQELRSRVHLDDAPAKTSPEFAAAEVEARSHRDHIAMTLGLLARK